MEQKAVLRALPGLIRPNIPATLRDFRSGARWAYLVKIYYGNELIHYEASHRPKAKTVDVGLHFESDELTNARLLGAFRTHERAVRRRLPDARLEKWDRGWTRIWEPVAYESYDGQLRALLASKLARYITVLEPILRNELPADVVWKA
jgi:hypothetical protein